METIGKLLEAVKKHMAITVTFLLTLILTALLLLVTGCVTMDTLLYKKLADCSDKQTLCKVKYARVYDGDTIYVDIPHFPPMFEKDFGIRLKDVDTPELRTSDTCEKEKAYEAKAFVVSKLAAARRLDLVNCTRGKYFRLVCDILADNEDLGSMLLENNLAVTYDGKGRKK